MMEKSGKRYEVIDILRGMAVLMVILYHSIIVYPVDLHQIPWCAALHRFLWTLQMPLFFFVSGFCYSKKDSYGRYIKGRVLRILIPHFVFSLLDIIPRLIANPLVNDSGSSASEAITDLLLYGGNDWFLLTLFVICALFPLIELIPGIADNKISHNKILNTDISGESGISNRDESSYGGLFTGNRIILVILSLILYLFHNRIPDIFCINMACGFLIWYVLGYILKRCPEIFNFLRAKPVISFIAVGLMAYRYYSTAASQITLRASEFFFVLSGGIICIRIASMVNDRIKTRSLTPSNRSLTFSGRFLTLCGRWSLQMYLLDPYALVATRTLLCRFLGITSPLIIILGNFIPDTLIVLAISVFIIERVRILHFIFGIYEGNR